MFFQITSLDTQSEKAHMQLLRLQQKNLLVKKWQSRHMIR